MTQQPSTASTSSSLIGESSLVAVNSIVTPSWPAISQRCHWLSWSQLCPQPSVFPTIPHLHSSAALATFALSLTALAPCRYYYAEKGTDGRGGGFLNGALEDGFLKVNQSDVKFSLMWANQDWVDVHPAKRGWSNTYRSVCCCCCVLHGALTWIWQIRPAAF